MRGGRRDGRGPGNGVRVGGHRSRDSKWSQRRATAEAILTKLVELAGSQSKVCDAGVVQETHNASQDVKVECSEICQYTAKVRGRWRQEAGLREGHDSGVEVVIRGGVE